MKKHLCILTFLFSIYGSSQDLIGKWYMVNRSGLVETEITKDSITFNQIFSNFTEKSSRSKTGINILKKVKQKDRTIFIYQSEKGSTKFFALLFSSLQKNKTIKLIWNGLDKSETIDELIELNKNDKKTLYGYNLYSKDHVEELKKRKSIKSMSLADFKGYLSAYFKKVKLPLSEMEKLPQSFLGPFTFNTQIISQTLLELGYNPIQDSEPLENLYKKYMEVPEIKILIEELKAKPK